MAKATLTPVYDANGRLVGVTDPAKIQPVADTTPVAKAANVVELKKGLGGAGLAADHDRRAAAMGDAAFRVLAAIHSRAAA